VRYSQLLEHNWESPSFLDFPNTLKTNAVKHLLGCPVCEKG
jgi:hypothetical protein